MKRTLPEDVFHSGLTWIGIALRDQGHGHSQASSLEHHVFCREASVSPVHSKGEGEVLTIAHHLLAQELGWNADTWGKDVRRRLQRSTPQPDCFPASLTRSNEVPRKVAV